MEIKPQPLLNFNSIDFANVNVNLVKRYINTEQSGIELAISPKVFFPKDSPNDFTIILEVKVTSKEYFNISLVAFAGFTLNRPAKDAESRSFINVNAPAIAFPYVRAFLSTLSSNLGTAYPPIILPPHFFKGELEEYIPSEEEN